MRSSPISQSLTIGRLARAADVGVETIRYYQDRKLLPVPESDGAFRYRVLEKPDELGRTYLLYSVGPDGKDNGGADAPPPVGPTSALKPAAPDFIINKPRK